MCDYILKLQPHLPTVNEWRAISYSQIIHDHQDYEAGDLRRLRAHHDIIVMRFRASNILKRTAPYQTHAGSLLCVQGVRAECLFRNIVSEPDSLIMGNAYVLGIFCYKL